MKALLIIGLGAVGAIYTGHTGIFTLIVCAILYRFFFRREFERMREKRIVLERLRKA